ncbi:carbohydrate-binding protein [Paenibacillus sp. Soil766]|uniref:carbohydrate-binding protein n=1 Tax=Paenibacillus sp. Soil766 TaxID=1736404 RepID=UPI0007C6F6C0|nr:carbohydrate-binding protein [Paenibacillus sp. Soil766]
MKKWKKMLGVTMALTVVLTSSPVITERVEAATTTVTPAIGKTPGNANPLFTQKFGADPNAMVYNGRVYVYMTNDVFEYNADGTIKDNGYSKINKITVVSSDDMINWTDHGEIPVAGAQGAAKWANNSWAPAAAHKTIDGKEKFFLYFADSANGIGVLTADSPIGPFTDPIGKALVNRNTPGASDVTWLFDPAVLVDDDGSGYIYFGGGVPTGKEADPGTARVAKLGADMISLDLTASGGTLGRINPPWLFEDSGIHKYNGKYYYSYCTNFSSGHPADIPTGTIAYMVSDNPMGPFTYVKTILPNPASFFGVGGNNHHAVFEFNDQWYIVYHAQTLAKALAESGTVPQMGGQPHGYRNAHINKVNMDANGVIQNITGDYKGVPQLKNFNPYTRVEAETIGWNGGISTETTTEPGGMVSSINLAVSNISDGDWTAVSKVDFGDVGAGIFKATVASGSAGGTIELRLDSADGALIGTLPISNTGGDNIWKTETTNVTGAAGVHDVYMVYRGASSGNLFKVDSWQFAQKSAVHELAAINASIDKQKIDIVSGTNQATTKVTAVYSDGTSEDITAQATSTSSPSGIVSVSNGVVTGTGYGTATINVSYGGKTDTLNLQVKDLNSELTVKKITVDNASFALDTGRTATFKITAEYMDGHTEDVTKSATYTNSSPAVADVANGTITAKTSGTSNVTVSYKGTIGDAATTQINVSVNTPAVVAIEAEAAAENTVNAYVYGTINGHTWSLVDGQSTKAMLFGPDDATAITSGTDAASLAAGSRLNYKINFPASGTYNVWLLAKSRNFQTDSIHVGLDNQYKFTSNGIQNVSNSQFRWVNLSNGGTAVTGGTTINVSAGEHVLNLWGRESGLIIDRILLTTSNATTDPIWPEQKVPTAAISADSSVKPGSSFTVAVNLDNLAQSVYAQDITLSYDANVFDYVSATGANNNIQIVKEDKLTAGKVRLIAANIGGVTGASTPVLNVNFKVKAGVHDTTGAIATTQVNFGVGPEGTVIQGALSSKNIAVGSVEIVVDKSALTAAIANAQSLFDTVVVGTQTGQYPQTAKDAFGVAINAAKAVNDNVSATQSQVDSTVTALGSAVDIFKAAVMKSADMNNDGSINVGDLAMVAYHYGKDSTSADWATAKAADVNADNKIDILDIAFVATKILE